MEGLAGSCPEQPSSAGGGGGGAGMYRGYFCHISEYEELNRRLSVGGAATKPLAMTVCGVDELAAIASGVQRGVDDEEKEHSSW